MVWCTALLGFACCNHVPQFTGIIVQLWLSYGPYHELSCGLISGTATAWYHYCICHVETHCTSIGHIQFRAQTLLQPFFEHLYKLRSLCMKKELELELCHPAQEKKYKFSMTCPVSCKGASPLCIGLKLSLKHLHLEIHHEHEQNLQQWQMKYW